MTTIIGIDPGLVHTGVVLMHPMGSDPRDMQIITQVFERDEMDIMAKWVKARTSAHVFVEAYRPRGNTYGTDGPMRELMAELRLLLPKAKVIDNTGMKFVVKQALMEVLNVWAFETSTHHQDLRSAARIGLYGALKDDDLNAVLYEYVTTTKETTHGHP